ncbi:MAG: hypothetical protein N3D10_00320 [Candidatus Micrarchaeota archaeon]|nr:hypothetical protein [Candidatus Micrarchaeota archaeon]
MFFSFQQMPQSTKTPQQQLIQTVFIDFNSTQNFLSDLKNAKDKIMFLLENFSHPISFYLQDLLKNRSKYLTLDPNSRASIFFYTNFDGINQTTFEFRPDLKKDFQNLVLIQLLCNPASVTKEIFNIAFNNEPFDQTKVIDFINRYKEDIDSIQRKFNSLGLPIFFGEKASFYEVYSNPKNFYYMFHEFGSEGYTSERQKFQHFFPGAKYLHWAADQIVTSIKFLVDNRILPSSMSVSINQNWEQFSKELQKYLQDNFGIDISDFLISYPNFEAPRDLYTSFLKSSDSSNKVSKLLDKLQNEYDVPNTKNQSILNKKLNDIKNSLHKNSLDENTSFLFNFFGAAGCSYWLSSLIALVFFDQVETGKDGPFKFDKGGREQWRNYFSIYNGMFYNKDGSINYDKIDNLLTTDFIKDDKKLNIIKQKRDHHEKLTIEEINYLSSELMKSLFTFSIFSFASGENILEADSISYLSVFKDFIMKNLEILTLLKIKLNTNSVEKVKDSFSKILKYGFFGANVSYVVCDVDYNPFSPYGELKYYPEAEEWYSFSEFAKDVSIYADKNNNPTLKKELIQQGFVNYLPDDVLPTKEDQQNKKIKVGWVDQQGTVHFGDGSTKVSDIIQKGGKIVYFLEKSDLSFIKKQFFSQDGAYKTVGDLLMKKHRRLSVAGNGSTYSLYTYNYNENNQNQPISIYKETKKYCINPLDENPSLKSVIVSNKTQIPNFYSYIVTEDGQSSTISNFKDFTTEEPPLDISSSGNKIIYILKGVTPAYVAPNPFDPIDNIPAIHQNPPNIFSGVFKDPLKDRYFVVTGYKKSQTTTEISASVEASTSSTIVSRGENKATTFNNKSSINLNISFPFSISSIESIEQNISIVRLIIKKSDNKLYLYNPNKTDNNLAKLYNENGEAVSLEMLDNLLKNYGVGSIDLYEDPKAQKKLFSITFNPDKLDFSIIAEEETNNSIRNYAYTHTTDPSKPGFSIKKSPNDDKTLQITLPMVTDSSLGRITIIDIPYIHPFELSLEKYLSGNGSISGYFNERNVFISRNDGTIKDTTSNELFKLDLKNSRVIFRNGNPEFVLIIDKNSLNKENLKYFLDPKTKNTRGG